MIKTWIDNLSPKQLFLIDGIGALITATLLVQLLARFPKVFGMPEHVLHILALVAALFAAYSLTCHFLIKSNWKPYLTIIGISNSIYCLITVILIITLYDQITLLCIVYFVGEIFLVMSLVRVEFLIANKS